MSVDVVGSVSNAPEGTWMNGAVARSVGDCLVAQECLVSEPPDDSAAVASESGAESQSDSPKSRRCRCSSCPDR